MKASKESLEQERREQILDAAETVFAERGFSQARMDDIVRASGLSKGALYWYYKGKDAIVMALLDRIFGAELEEARELVALERPAEERMRMIVLAAAGEIRRFEKLMPLGYEFVALAARRKEVRQRLASYYRGYTEPLAEIVRQGVERGEFKPIDPHQVALALIAAYEGLALLWFVDPESVDWDVMSTTPLELILEGIQKERR